METLQAGPICQHPTIRRKGVTRSGVQKYQCQNPACPHPYFRAERYTSPYASKADYMAHYRQRQHLQQLGPLTAPFPYPGGKSAVAAVIWQALGTVRNYIEPFGGSLAVLLARPHPLHAETVGDLDGHIINLWRALKADHTAVAHHAEALVSDIDLRARHDVLCHERDALTAQLRADPEFSDARLAGYWLYCRSAWAGSGGFGRNAGQDPTPLLTHTGNGIYAIGRRGKLLQICASLKERLHWVRAICGDWQDLLTPARLFGVGHPVGVFLDPPYGHERQAQPFYAAAAAPCAPAVRAWAVAHGEDTRLRIALCGLEGEHAMPASWTAYHWQARGGLANTKHHGRGSGETRQEVVWFSPHCLQPMQQLALPV
jgi:hypothetical protein